MATEEIVIIIALADLQAHWVPPSVRLNILAKHDATNRVMATVKAERSELQHFLNAHPTAGVMRGDNYTPENHNEWRMLALSPHVKGSTDPVEIFTRGRAQEQLNAHSMEPNNDGRN